MKNIKFKLKEVSYRGTGLIRASDGVEFWMPMVSTKRFMKTNTPNDTILKAYNRVINERKKRRQAINKMRRNYKV